MSPLELFLRLARFDRDRRRAERAHFPLTNLSFVDPPRPSGAPRMTASESRKRRALR